MTILSATTPPSIIQNSTEQRQNLAADLSALIPAQAICPEASAVLHRPAILRRIAAALSGCIPAGTDRLVACSDQDTALAIALSLHTGISFALVDVPSTGVIGELHSAERTVLLAYTPNANEDEVLEILTAAGARPRLSLTVFADHESADPALTRHALFSFAELSTINKESHHV
ncbi:hypothetical protein [Arthrobacter pigmenti]